MCIFLYFEVVIVVCLLLRPGLYPRLTLNLLNNSTLDPSAPTPEDCGLQMCTSPELGVKARTVCVLAVLVTVLLLQSDTMTKATYK